MREFALITHGLAEFLLSVWVFGIFPHGGNRFAKSWRLLMLKLYGVMVIEVMIIQISLLLNPVKYPSALMVSPIEYPSVF